MAENSNPPTIPTRDEVRAAIFATKKLAKENVEFFGTTLELRQPKLSDIIAIQQAQKDGGTQSAVIEALIKYAYVPGSDTKVFEDTDEASLLELPFGEDLSRVSAALERLTKVNFQGGSGSSDKT